VPASEADLSESDLDDTKQRGKRKQAGERSRAVDKKRPKSPAPPAVICCFVWAYLFCSEHCYLQVVDASKPKRKKTRKSVDDCQFMQTYKTMLKPLYAQYQVQPRV